VLVDWFDGFLCTFNVPQEQLGRAAKTIDMEVETTTKQPTGTAKRIVWEIAFAPLVQE
jgi:hypothetical protein